MKVLLDENIDIRFKLLFDPEIHQVLTVKYMAWNGIKNGKLLKLAADEGFEAFICVDKNLPYQQNLHTLPLPVLVVNVHKNVLINLKGFIGSILDVLAQIKENKIYIVETK